MSAFPKNDPLYRTGYVLDAGRTVITPVARLSYPYLVSPQMPEPGKNELKEPKYNCSLLFDGDADFTFMHELLTHVLLNGKQKFGLDKDKWGSKFQLPFHEQSEKKQDGYDPRPGFKYINVGGKQKPEIVGLDGATRIIDETQIYAGCYVRAVVNAYDYDNKMKGVKFGLEHIQFIAHGEPMGNKTRVEGAFKPVAAAAPSGLGGSAAAPANASALFS